MDNLRLIDIYSTESFFFSLLILQPQQYYIEQTTERNQVNNDDKFTVQTETKQTETFIVQLNVRR